MFGNQVLVPLSTDGKICVYTLSDAAVIFDVNGYMTTGTGGGLTPVALQRVVDTRTGTGVGGVAGPVTANGTVRFRVTGVPGFPADATAALMNITVTGAQATGYMTAYPCARGRPNASSVNYVPASSVGRHLVVPLDANGEICVYSVAEAHLILDLSAAFTPSGKHWRGQMPTRIFDSRSRPGGTDALRASVPSVVPIPGMGSAVTLNVAAVMPSADGWLAAYDCDGVFPGVSNINFSAGAVVPNLVTVQVGPSRNVCLLSSANTHAVVDQAGNWVP